MSFVKNFFSVWFCFAFLFTVDAQAMSFNQITEIGYIGSPAQSPYSGFIISGETFNSGAAYTEPNFFENKPVKSYKTGVARFGDGKDALFCKYDFNAKDFNRSLAFGGENNYILTLDGSDKKIYKLENNSSLPMYIIYHNYCATDLKIVGKTKNGKWVTYVDSKKISDAYFGGNDGYKLDGGIMYNMPICKGDSIVTTYYRWTWQGDTPIIGEFRLRWDDKAMWFGIEQVVY